MDKSLSTNLLKIKAACASFLLLWQVDKVNSRSSRHRIEIIFTSFILCCCCKKKIANAKEIDSLQRQSSSKNIETKK